MTVLVLYATRHGATRGIAERIGAGLAAAGLSVEVKAADERPDPARYDAFVIGSAAYMGRWLKEAGAYVRRHREALAQRPVWLFSSGPLGTERIDAQGRDQREASRPRELDELRPTLHPRGERVFFGAWDPQAAPVGLAEHFQRRLPAAWMAGVAGDFRDWPAIDAWAAEIAAQLHPADATPGGAP
jgi:menaquinone-dependent protoporphyrinogen oxidase